MAIFSQSELFNNFLSEVKPNNYNIMAGSDEKDVFGLSDIVHKLSGAGIRTSGRLGVKH